MTAWRKAGHRSLIHRGYPKLVVRFDGRGVGTGKLLTNAREFEQTAILKGRRFEDLLAELVKDAEKAWPELNKPNTERKQNE